MENKPKNLSTLLDEKYVNKKKNHINLKFWLFLQSECKLYLRLFNTRKKTYNYEYSLLKIFKALILTINASYFKFYASLIKY